MSIERINLIGVPVDVCEPENLEAEILELLAKPGTKQIVFLSIWDLLKARRKNDFSECIKNADLILPISKSILRLGSHKKTLMKTEKNVRDTFPGLRIVGRYVGYYPKQDEDDIVQAIFKSQPSLVLVSEGIKDKNCWAYKRRNRFSSSLFLYYKDCFGIFSERIQRIKE